MKKILFVVVAGLTALFAFTGCSKKTDKDQLAQIKENGEIVIAMEGCWAPWTYHDENDTLVGFDVEVGKLIAQKLGVKAKFVEVDWDGIFAGIDAKRYDMACNGVGYTEERALKYDFTAPYAFTHTALIVKKSDDSIKSFSDLKGKTTTNSLGSTYATLAESLGAKVVTIDSFDETLELVAHGRADATLNDSATFYYYNMVQPDNMFKVASLTEESEKICIPLRKGEESKSLRQAIDTAIAELMADGSIARASEKYFGSDISR